jgi:aarF domain-containing kinase
MLRHACSNQCSDVEGFKKELGAIVLEARQATVSLGKVGFLFIMYSLQNIVLNVCRFKWENFSPMFLALAPNTK